MDRAPETKLIWLNHENHASDYTYDYCKRLMTDSKEPLIGAVLGSAYGGELEAVGRLWGDKGTIYGLDTFEGHPRHLAEDMSSFEATCMDFWYSPSKYGTESLRYDMQQKAFDDMGLDNVKLIKGLIAVDSLNDIPYLDYALLDLDIYASMKTAYEAVKDKIKIGRSLFLHDCVSESHLPKLYHLLHDEIMPSGLWELKNTWHREILTELVRI